MTGVEAATIRPAGIEDAEALRHLAGQLGYAPSETDIHAAMGDLDGVSHTVLVAEVCGRMVGWIELQSHRLLSSGFEALVAGLVVDESVRGQGLGRQLMAAAEHWAHKIGASAIRVRSRDTRERAHKFYRDLGYEEVKRQVVFRKNLT